MKINEIKINGFGKLKNKEIEFKDGINIVYGENETGKSTILKFISSMLYGVSKNKNGKELPDFDKYKPWDDAEFSGKIKYEINDNTYEIFREFKKKNPEIYNEFGENISKEFKADKSKGINFFEEQTGIDEKSFFNTSIIEQQAVKLDKSDTNIIIQKISNLVSTGDDNISFKKSIDKINKMQVESIGNDRTKQKPINIVCENIYKLSQEKNNLKKYKENINSQEIQKEKIDEQIEFNLKQLNQEKDKLKIAKEEAKNDEIKDIENKLKFKICFTIAIVLIILSILLFVFVKNIFAGLVPIIISLIDIFVLLKLRKEPDGKSANYDIHKIEKNIENIETKINDLKVKKHIFETERNNIDEQLERLAKVEEELFEQNQIKSELESLNISFNIAKECLENAYEEIKHNISPKFERNLCEITANITDGKYKNVSINDESMLNVEIENGSYMPAYRLSIGTIDEMYLALRLSMLEEISNEKLPLIFDETFAYFDNNRLKNILCYLQDKNYDNQIIIFTCSNREEDILKELKIEYNLIRLEK